MFYIIIKGVKPSGMASLFDLSDLPPVAPKARTSHMPRAPHAQESTARTLPLDFDTAHPRADAGHDVFNPETGKHIHGGQFAPKPAAQVEREPAEPRFKDVGERIGGSRKEIAAAKLRWAELPTVAGLLQLEQLDRAAAIRACHKSAFWPMPKLDAMVDDGWDPFCAVMAKQIYNALPAGPPDTDAESMRRYAEGVTWIAGIVNANHTDRHALTAALKDNLTQVYGSQSDAPDGAVGRFNSVSYPARLVSHVWADHIHGMTQAPSGKGDRQTQHELLNGVLGSYKSKTTYLSLRPGSLAWNLDRFADGEDQAVRKAAAWNTEFPTDPMSSLQLLALWHGLSREVGKPDGLTHAKKAKPADEQSAEARKQAKLWERKTSGKYDREGGSTATVNTVESYLSMFGIRGVEFGNWMQDDSTKHHVQYCAEAFMDLADAMGVPSTDIGWQNRLALAFGARGSGSFLAHYEPHSTAINLTKHGGAGSLAHEYGHFLDDVIGRIARGRTTADNHHASDVTVKGDPIAGQVQEIIRLLTKTGDAHTITHTTAAPVTRTISGVGPDGSPGVKTVPSGPSVREWVLKEAGATPDVLAGKVPAPPDFLDRCRTILTRSNASKPDVLLHLLNDCAAKAHVTGRTVDVDMPGGEYYAGMQELGPYWARPTELFARAFETYVHDKLESMGGRRNSYLVYGAKMDGHWASEGLDPYIQGAMRQKVGAAFDDLFAIMRDEDWFGKAVRGLFTSEAMTARAKAEADALARIVADRKRLRDANPPGKHLGGIEIDHGNYHQHTEATWNPAVAPSREPDHVSKSGSRYWHTPRGIYRQSDHWSGDSGIGPIGSSECTWTHGAGPGTGTRTGYTRLKAMRVTTKAAGQHELTERYQPEVASGNVRWLASGCRRIGKALGMAAGSDGPEVLLMFKANPAVAAVLKRSDGTRYGIRREHDRHDLPVNTATRARLLASAKALHGHGNGPEVFDPEGETVGGHWLYPDGTLSDHTMKSDRWKGRNLFSGHRDSAKNIYAHAGIARHWHSDYDPNGKHKLKSDPLKSFMGESGAQRVSADGGGVAVHAQGHITPQQMATIGQLYKMHRGKPFDWEYDHRHRGGLHFDKDGPENVAHAYYENTHGDGFRSMLESEHVQHGLQHKPMTKGVTRESAEVVWEWVCKAARYRPDQSQMSFDFAPADPEFEHKHPRADDGKFAEKSGAAAPEAPANIGARLVPVEPGTRPTDAKFIGELAVNGMRNTFLYKTGEGQWQAFDGQPKTAQHRLNGILGRADLHSIGTLNLSATRSVSRFTLSRDALVARGMLPNTEMPVGPARIGDIVHADGQLYTVGSIRSGIAKLEPTSEYGRPHTQYVKNLDVVGRPEPATIKPRARRSDARSDAMEDVEKGVQHMAAGQSVVNPGTGKTVSGGQFAPSASGLIRQYNRHMQEHPGQPRRAVSLPHHIENVGNLQAQASSQGIGFQRETAPRAWQVYSYPTTATLTNLREEIGADAMGRLEAHVATARAHDVSERDAVAKERARLDEWVQRRLALKDKIDEAFDAVGAPTEYVRQGFVSPGHRSHNYRENTTEEGTSVFPARRFGGKLYITRFMASSAFFVPNHVCTGDVLNETGSDDEPLLDVKTCRKARKGEIVML